MTFRWQPTAFSLVTVAVWAYLDSWVGGAGPFALVIAALILAPGLVWNAVAPTAAAAWWTAIASTSALTGCVLLSRVTLSHGPAAPIIDWFAPYAAVAVIVHVTAMAATRAFRGPVWLSLLPIVLITPLWLVVTVVGQSTGGQGATPRSVQPLNSAWSVTRTIDEGCGQNGAVCAGTIKIADAEPEAIRAQLRRAGWASWCRPNTGLLSRIGYLDYGRTCITITGTTVNAVQIDILGKATWWPEYDELR
ncbi:hypothetical protein [Catellatospora methionotrophica]|uniref:hypothetical protein n=1 Tax=Catellatospora methionotrophica TaxID=121620 RepID=UPI0033E22BA4